ATLEGIVQGSNTPSVNGDRFGYQVSLSSDGSIVAISGYQRNWVRVFSWNGSAWVRLGVDILGKGDITNDNFGTRLQLSSDGTRLVVSAPLDGLYGSGNPDMRYAGNVRVYDYTPSGTASWTHIGQDIYGTVGGGVYGDRSGSEGLSISDDGSRIAIGSHSYDGGGPYLSSYNDNRGQVRIFEYTPSGTASWTQLGPSIDGETGDSSGYSVTLSSDGSIVAISSPQNDSYGTNKGIVRIYSYTPSGVSSWTQLGAPIVGEAENDGMGKVSISDDGSIIAIGASSNDGYGTSSGHVRIFRYTPSGVSSWTQVGIDIDGEAAGDLSGLPSLSSDGSKVAIGGAGNYPNGEYRPRGHVRIFSTAADTSTPTVTLTDTDLDNLVSGSSVVTITATFSEAMSATPTINITGEVSNVAMTASRTARVWIYPWTVSATTNGIVTATVSGTDLSGNAYSGTDSITLTVDNTVPGVLLVSDNTDSIIGPTGVVSISTYFSETLSTTPTLSISGLVTNTVMSKFSSTPITQIGQLIDDSAGGKLGWTSDISESGNRIIVGGPYGSSRSFARVYQWNGKQWEQLGNEITGTSSNDLGRPVGISGDGSVIVVGERGTSNNDFIYKIYTLSGSSWVLRETLNDDNDGTTNFTRNGSVDLSYDGSIIALSHGVHDNKGRARIFEWNNTNYIQMGSDILGPGSNSLLGDGWNGISLTKNGKRIVIGVRNNGGGSANDGIVRVYDWGGSAWTQVGTDISDPVGTADSFGSSVSISSDGQTIIAGAPSFSSGPGRVHIFTYKLISGTASWTYKASISGTTNGDYFGYSSSINGNGDKIIVGAYDGDFATQGYARLYSWDGTTASQIGTDIVGDANGDAFGAHVELSANGIAIIGAPFSDSGGTDSGQVKVIGTDRYEYSWDVDGGGAPSDGTYYATVAGTDKVGNAYSGTDSITFTIDSTSPATLAITSNDSDNVITTGQVTLTATFSQNMTASPTISISGVVTNVSMTQSTTAAVWTYYWQVPSNISSGTTLNVTATATDTNSLSYSGNASLTLTISPTFYLDANGVTVKCRGCSVGDTGMVSGTLYKAVGDATYINGTASDNSLHREIQIWSSSGSQGNYQLCTTLVTDMSDLFGTVPVNNLISTWDTSNVTDMSEMFMNGSFPSSDYDLTKWDTSNVTDMRSMFVGVRGNWLISTWDTSSVTTMKSMFENAYSFNNDISSWDVSSVTTMESMFEHAEAFDQPIGAWGSTTASVTKMKSMFEAARAFNQNIGAWDTSNVTNMYTMFFSDSGNMSFNNGGSPDIGNWDTSSVTTMYFMFYGNSEFDQPLGSGGGVSGWDVSSVLVFESMFQGATKFNQDIGSWDVSGSQMNSYWCEATFREMFYGARDFNNGGSDSIKNWDMTGACNVNLMFYSTAMNQDLSTWCVPNVTSRSSFASRWDGVYDNGNARPRIPLSDAKTPVWGKCPSIATLVLTSDDSDNIITTSQVTLTATFSLSMSPTPTISISGVVTNVAMTQTSTDTVWTYFWQVPGSITSETNLNVTATATDTNSRTYVGTESLTITIDSFDPTLSFSDTDADNLLSATDSVTITASFNEAMTATPTISITGAVTNVIMIPQNGLILKGNSSFWNNGEPNNSGSNENVAELSTNKVNDIPSNISQKSIIEFSDNRNSTISNFTYVGSYQ
ncbi:BspA family leucine-rich repeat surface protein, partial [Flavobacteriaceae bacterium]|nr:BspA family leucine-rich repeat surface protein [Flavobacteriaceae bacterium]